MTVIALGGSKHPPQLAGDKGDRQNALRARAERIKCISTGIVIAISFHFGAAAADEESADPAPGSTAPSQRVQVIVSTGHAGGIRKLRMSDDGRQVETYDESTVKVWDVAGQNLIKTSAISRTPEEVKFEGNSGADVHGAPEGSSDKWLVAISQPESTLSLLGLRTPPEPVYVVRDLVAGVDRFTIPIPPSATRSVPIVGPGNRNVYAIRSDGAIEAYALPEGKKALVAPADPEGDALGEFVISENERTLARSNRSGSVDVFDIATGQRRVHLSKSDFDVPDVARLGLPASVIRMRPAPGASRKIELSRDGERLLVNDYMVAYVWELGSRKLLASLAASVSRFGPDGRHLVFVKPSGHVPAIADLSNGATLTFGAAAEAPSELAISADNRYLVGNSGGVHGGGPVWDLFTGELVRRIGCGSNPVTSISASPRDSLIAIACLDGSSWLSSIDTEAFSQQMTAAGDEGEDSPPTPTKISFGADGDHIAIAHRTKITIWSLRERRIVSEGVFTPPPGSSAKSNNGTCGVDRKMLVDQGKFVALPPAAQKALKRQYELLCSTFNKFLDSGIQVAGYKAQIRAIAIHPDGRHIAFSLSEGTFIWDSRTSLPAQNLGGANRNLAFSGDGAKLFTDRHIITMNPAWAALTLPESSPPGASEGLQAQQPSGAVELALNESISPVQDSSRSLAASKDGKLFVVAEGRYENSVAIRDSPLGKIVRKLDWPSVRLVASAFSPDGSRLVTSAVDGTIRVWSLPSGRELAALISLGTSDYAAITPDQYYRASRHRLTEIFFALDDRRYPVEQFDLRFNRPDIMLARLGHADESQVAALHLAYEKRLRKLGFSETQLGSEIHIPLIEVIGEAPPISTPSSEILLSVQGGDDRYPLDRFNVLVNDVPVYGSSGLAVRDRELTFERRDIRIPLVAGLNKVQVSVVNQKGAESLRQTTYTTSTAQPASRDVYIVAIGVSHYKNPRYDLRYAAKDAADLIDAYTRLSGSEGQIHVLDLSNEKAIRARIRDAKDFLAKSKTNDLTVVFAAGHGMIDSQQEYYFGTFDIDPERPQENGLPYVEFEALLDGIPALKKLLLIDTCFSGELEKEQPTSVASEESGMDGAVNMRTFKAPRNILLVPGSSAQTASVNTPPSDFGIRHIEDLFADLRQGTGAVVISSAGGNEYALEGDQWRNGVFTYALLSGLKQGRADANKDGIVTVSELQSYVVEAVRRLTAGGQTPTVRRENLDFDFAVY